MTYNSQSFVWLEDDIKYPITVGKMLALRHLRHEVDGRSENKLEGMSGAAVSATECRN